MPHFSTYFSYLAKLTLSCNNVCGIRLARAVLKSLGAECLQLRSSRQQETRPSQQRVFVVALVSGMWPYSKKRMYGCPCKTTDLS